MQAVVTGMIATYPVGGVAWDYGQYILGLNALGFETYYLEDTGGPTYDPTKRRYGDDCAYGLRFLSESLASLSPELKDRWHFRSATDECFGLPQSKLNDLVRSADVFLNVSGSALLRDDYMSSQRKVLIDTDPGWNHFVNYPRWDAHPGWQGTHGYRAHDYFFTYAERLGRAGCLLPDMGIAWHPTRPPVALDKWHSRGPGRTWTTVMTWNNFLKPVEYQGRVFGTKEIEFAKIETAPTVLPEFQFEIAKGGADAPVSRWQQAGWRIIDSHSISTTPDDYRTYIETSRGELSVAKNLYVATGCGWFSCRSACYLAAGRPVVIQDTGFSEIIPAGKGLLAFSDGAEAAAAIAAVESDYKRHSLAARAIAAEYFDSRQVLRAILRQVDLS
jgi:hypothetical protein